MDNTRDNNLKFWVLIIGILVILSGTAFAVVYTVFHSTQEALQPVNSLTSNMGTQVSQVLHPTPTIVPDPITVIHEVRSLARLETIQYTVEKVVTAENGQGPFGFLFGDKLLFVAHGVVIAGVDLSKMGPQDLYVQDNVLYVRMPAPEIFVATLDNNKSYVYNRQTGALTHGDTNLETAARQAAEAEIAKAAIEDGILNQAGQNAESYLSRMFLSLGYKDVIFLQSTPVPAPTVTPAP